MHKALPSAELGKQILWLQSKHDDLSRQVDLLERRAWLSGDERTSLSRLKKRKLRAKDSLEAARRRRNPTL
ncbi:MAG: YdcH family protein [Myxococcota bacterium]